MTGRVSVNVPKSAGGASPLAPIAAPLRPESSSCSSSHRRRSARYRAARRRLACSCSTAVSFGPRRPSSSGHTSHRSMGSIPPSRTFSRTASMASPTRPSASCAAYHLAGDNGEPRLRLLPPVRSPRAPVSVAAPRPRAARERPRPPAATTAAAVVPRPVRTMTINAGVSTLFGDQVTQHRCT